MRMHCPAPLPQVLVLLLIRAVEKLQARQQRQAVSP